MSATSDPVSHRPAAERTASEREWLRVNAYLQRNRHDLSVRAADWYPPADRVAGTPLLAAPAWRPRSPVPLGEIRLEWRQEPPAPRISDVADVAPELLPARADGTRYRRYSSVIEELASPTIFENRRTYRLIGADLAGPGPRLTFTRGRFFDGVDVGGAAGWEFAAAEIGAGDGQKLREALGDPCDLAARPGPMAVGALTLRHDRATGAASFPLHWRDPARVGHAGGMYQVIPVGIFQPSGEAPWNEANDFDLWRGLLREYAEELLGADEDHGSESAPIDYDRWPLAAAMTAGLGDGSVRAYCLGLGADPLTFALDLLTVVVIDAPLYDDLFGDLAEHNAEGTVLKPRPFDAPTVAELITRHPVQAAGAALLNLAVAHRQFLLSGLLGGAYQPLTSRARATRPGAAVRPRAWCPSRARGTPTCCPAAGRRPSPPRRRTATGSAPGPAACYRPRRGTGSPR